MLRLGVTAALAVLLVIPGRAQDVPAAMSRGVEYLISKQQADGSMPPCKYPTVVNAWAVLAIMSAGHRPSDATREGEAVRRLVERILESGQNVNGNVGYGRLMHEHGMVTVSLCELIASGGYSIREGKLRTEAESALSQIVASQSPNTGGWGYNLSLGHGNELGEIIANVFPSMAIHSARSAGIRVPETVLRGATRFAKDLKVGQGFAYQPKSGRRSKSINLSGVRALQAVGSREVHLQAAGLPSSGESYFHLNMLLYSQVMSIAGGDEGARAQEAVANILLPTQSADGAWAPNNASESAYSTPGTTAISVIALGARYHRLAIYRPAKDIQ